MYSSTTKSNGEVHVYHSSHKTADEVMQSYVLEAALPNKNAPGNIGAITVPVNLYKDKAVINFNLYDPQFAQSPAGLAKKVLSKALEISNNHRIIEVECLSEKSKAVQTLLKENLDEPESTAEFTREGNRNHFTTLRYVNNLQKKNSAARTVLDKLRNIFK